MCYVPDVFATGAALLEEAKSRAPPPRDAISTAERPWARCAELRRRPGSTRWPPGPRRRGPEGRTRARPLGRRRPARGSISTAERPWARCAELRRRPGSTRWPQGPRRRGPEGRTRARASEAAGRLASSQVLQHVPRRSLSRRMRSRARRGTRREIHRYRWTGLGRRGALYIFV